MFCDVFWKKMDFEKFSSIKTETWLSARIQQALGKQAIEIVKGQRCNKTKLKPTLKRLSLNLDSRFVSFVPMENSFDLWVKINCLGRGINLVIPIKKHRQFNGLVQDGWKLKGSTRLSIRDGDLILDVYFEKQTKPLKKDGEIIGVDVGYKKLLATSDGKCYGKDFDGIASKIQRRKHGSKGFERALKERNDYVNKTVKLLPWIKTGVFVIEDLKGLKNGRKFRKEFQGKYQRWTYPVLVNRIKLTAERQGVLVSEVDPSFTSQTCSRCGCKDKNNRRGEVFSCTSCFHSSDADVNASVNILTRFRLPEHMDPDKSVPFDIKEQILSVSHASYHVREPAE